MTPVPRRNLDCSNASLFHDQLERGEQVGVRRYEHSHVARLFKHDVAYQINGDSDIDPLL